LFLADESGKKIAKVKVKENLNGTYV